MSPDVIGRSFALLDQTERDRLAPLLRPLPWIDGLITAELIGPADPNETDDLEEALNWLDAIWSEGKEDEIQRLTPRQNIEIVTPVMDHYCHVAETVCDETESYRPYLAGYSDSLDAAAQWAAGFCGGISLNPEAWAPLFADEDARSLLVAIFSLVREEDMPEDVRADSPFRQIPPERLERMRRSAVEMLPEIVLSLHDHMLGLSEDEEDLELDDDDPDDAGSGKK
jgi:yecA family protein